MVKRTITYPDFNGESRTEDHYFNYNEAELSKLEWSKNGGFSEYLKRIIDAKDMESIAQVFDQVILETYGVKSLDGKYFQKGKDHEYARAFMESGAYPVFFMDLVSTPGALAKFFNELIPAKLVEKANEAAKRVEEEEAARKANAIKY